MSTVLNGTTLKQPSNIARTPIQTSKQHTTLDGVTKRDIVRQKELFTLTLANLTTTQINQVVGIYELKQSVSLVISELSINTTVWVDIVSRVNEAIGSDYRETIIINLEEV